MRRHIRPTYIEVGALLTVIDCAWRVSKRKRKKGGRDCELVRSVPGLDQVVELDLPCMAEKGDEVIPFFAYKFAMIGMMSSEIFV